MDSALLNKLLKIDTSTPEAVNTAIEYCASYLRKRGIDGETVENQGLKSYIAVIGEGETTLVFNGHLDVVSGTKEQFEPHEKDGRIYGRGTADMKSGCAAMIGAFIELKKKELPCRIMLQLVPDEETGGKAGTAFLVEQGYTGDFVICTEPTNLNISLKTKGIINVLLETRGVSAHGSRPWEGVNAIEKAFADFEKIKALPILNESSPYYEKSSVSLGKISGGDILNRVPDKCIMGLDIRYVPHLQPGAIIEAISSVTDGSVTIGMQEPAVDTQADDPRIVILKKTVSQITGKPCELTAAHGGSDGRFFFKKGIPAVELGPAGDFWHGDSEYVEKQSIVQLEEILIRFAMQFRSN